MTYSYTNVLFFNSATQGFRFGKRGPSQKAVASKNRFRKAKKYNKHQFNRFNKRKGPKKPFYWRKPRKFKRIKAVSRFLIRSSVTPRTHRKFFTRSKLQRYRFLFGKQRLAGLYAWKLLWDARKARRRVLALPKLFRPRALLKHRMSCESFFRSGVLRSFRWTRGYARLRMRFQKKLKRKKQNLKIPGRFRKLVREMQVLQRRRRMSVKKARRRTAAQRMRLHRGRRVRRLRRWLSSCRRRRAAVLHIRRMSVKKARRRTAAQRMRLRRVRRVRRLRYLRSLRRRQGRSSLVAAWPRCINSARRRRWQGVCGELFEFLRSATLPKPIRLRRKRRLRKLRKYSARLFNGYRNVVSDLHEHRPRFLLRQRCLRGRARRWLRDVQFRVPGRAWPSGQSQAHFRKNAWYKQGKANRRRYSKWQLKIFRFRRVPRRRWRMRRRYGARAQGRKWIRRYTDYFTQSYHTKAGKIKALQTVAPSKWFRRCFLFGSKSKRNTVLSRYFRWQQAILRVTCRSSNIFVLARHRTRTELLTTGLYADFRPNKKRKRTRMTGMFIGARFGERLNESYMKTMYYQLGVAGKNAGRRGVIFGLRKLGIGTVFVRDLTPVVHNGTRPRKKRRL